MDGGEIVEGLRLSGERFGRLYPVLLDRYGNVVAARAYAYFH